MLKGSIVALVTPFDEKGQIDIEQFNALIEWHIASGTDALVLAGTTGEAPTLSHPEMLTLFQEAVLTAKGRIPIIAGTGSYDTAKTIHLTREAKKLGVDAALIVVPYYSRPTPAGCLQHFQEISKVGLPFLIYHHPGRVGIKLSVQTLSHLAQLPNAIGIKDAAGDLDHTLDLLHNTPTSIFSGDDSLIVPMMASGAIGDISIVANLIPREWKILTTLLLADQIDEAREFYKRYYPLVKAMVLETNPQCVKYALSLLGKCSSTMRLPLVEPQDETKAHIAQVMQNICSESILSSVCCQ